MYKLILKAIFVLFLTAYGHGLPAPVERLDNIDERGDTDEFYQGDIKLNVGTKAGIIGSRYRWPSGVVVYSIGQEFTSTERDRITAAMNEISQKTCIQFQVRGNETDYVEIIGTASGCWSYVGRQRGRQQLSLQRNGCLSHGIIAHELIHAIGYFHEQSRTDRDDYVTINFSNIQPGKEGNFRKYSESQVDPNKVSYDYESIMHYSAYAFAINYSVPTIIPKLSGVVIGQRKGLSVKDAQKIRNMYSC